MASKSDLQNKMVMLLHKAPLDPLSGLKMHYSVLSGKMWCYCETCHALGGVTTDGEMFGLATKATCRGTGASSRKARRVDLVS